MNIELLYLQSKKDYPCAEVRTISEIYEIYCFWVWGESKNNFRKSESFVKDSLYVFFFYGLPTRVNHLIWLVHTPLKLYLLHNGLLRVGSIPIVSAGLWGIPKK